VLAIANQKPGVLDRYGITRAQADRAAWTVDAEARRLEGAAAVNRVLAELGGAWAVVASAYRLRPVAAVEEALYRWFAPRRSRFHRLGVRPECDEPGADCA
jgi:predicted DCC family thiol-disulfide oxidoreductase YuxK